MQELHCFNFESERLTRQQAAQYLGLGPETLIRWATTGHNNLPFYKVGRRVFYTKSDLDAWLSRRKTERVNKENPYG